MVGHASYAFVAILLTISAVVGLFIVIDRLCRKRQFPGFWRTIKCILCSFGIYFCCCYLLHTGILIEYGVIYSKIKEALEVAAIFFAACLIAMIAVIAAKE